MTSDTSLFHRLKAGCLEDWQAYTRHPFVLSLADGTLAADSFRHYLMQDYVFLMHFSRAWALAVYKAESLSDMGSAAEVLNGLLNHEMALHRDYCRSWGIAPETLELTREARANMAYTRYVLDAGLSGDLLDLLAALAPCVVGYAEIGRERLADPGTRLESNPYRSWLETYGGSEFQALAQSVIDQMDRLAALRGGEQRLSSLQRRFGDATRLEIGFWDMGLARLD